MPRAVLAETAALTPSRRAAACPSNVARLPVSSNAANGAPLTRTAT